VNVPIIEPDGSVIAGLFAARKNAGVVFCDDYIGGGSLTNCLVRGRITGR
jgi:succinate dehydrogenase/fumarate reductase flavoprotein subunit